MLATCNSGSHPGNVWPIMLGYFVASLVPGWVAHLLGGANEISRPQIDQLLELRENYYHITGKHPGYKKYSEQDGKL